MLFGGDMVICSIHWTKWINNRGGIGVPANKSWESWRDEGHEHLGSTGFCGRLLEGLLAVGFFLCQYGLMYHLNIANGNKSIIVSSSTDFFYKSVSFFFCIDFNNFL